MGEQLRALSIQQPWAWLIVNGHKDIENRDWRCHRRGPVLIHAGKKVDRDALDDLRAGRHPVTYRPLRLDLPEVFETGGIVGEATIAGCVESSDSPWFVGRFGILMRDARPLPFQPCKGALGFFVPAPTTAGHDPGRAAYEARFAHARPRDVEPWDSLPPEVRAIWAHVEAKSRGQVVAPDDVREALIEAIRRGLSGDHWWIVAEPSEIANELIAGPLANLVASAAESDRWGSEYADAMDARMADAITMERIGSALAVFARIGISGPEDMPMPEWVAAVTGARAALKEAGLQRLLDPASGTPESDARRRA